MGLRPAAHGNARDRPAAPSVTEPESFRRLLCARSAYPFGGQSERRTAAFQSIVSGQRGPDCLRDSGAVAPSAVPVNLWGRTKRSPALTHDGCPPSTDNLCRAAATESIARGLSRCVKFQLVVGQLETDQRFKAGPQHRLANFRSRQGIDSGIIGACLAHACQRFADFRGKRCRRPQHIGGGLPIGRSACLTIIEMDRYSANPLRDNRGATLHDSNKIRQRDITCALRVRAARANIKGDDRLHIFADIGAGRTDIRHHRGHIERRLILIRCRVEQRNVPRCRRHGDRRTGRADRGNATQGDLAGFGTPASEQGKHDGESDFPGCHRRTHLLNEKGIAAINARRSLSCA